MERESERAQTKMRRNKGGDQIPAIKSASSATNWTTQSTLTTCNGGFCISLAVADDVVLVACYKHVAVLPLGAGAVKELPIDFHSTCIAYSVEKGLVAVGGKNAKVIPYSVSSDFAVASPNSWTFHIAKIQSVSWSPDNRRLATESLDNSVIVWDMEKPGEHPVIIKGAHAMSSVNAVLWLDAQTVVSAGQDSDIKIWNVPV
ncbi:hypothetical protein CAEBREN_25403 [Caenorhabditis brenneri]|uniref:Uncharacterized protein n=1 Tax=Caenorhabditis brenneri TaxID=135651 RepID=G0P0M9_CAEBE|nr:hypothetical protein CAEBREN_25403 [Caenorhabditis brenneri]